MIVLEGSDCVGKTTLADILCRQFALTYMHMGPPDAGFDHLGTYVRGYQPDRLWDRYHLGALVYGWALGKSDPAPLDELAVVRTWLRKKGALVVVVTADADAIAARWKPEREAYKLETAQLANDAYKRLPSDWWDLTIDTSHRAVLDSAERIADAWMQGRNR